MKLIEFNNFDDSFYYRYHKILGLKLSKIVSTKNRVGIYRVYGHIKIKKTLLTKVDDGKI